MTVSAGAEEDTGNVLQGPDPSVHPIQEPSGRPADLAATFQINLRCNSACGYCDLPLNVGRYELTREEIKQTFSRLYRDGVRFVLVQGGEPLLRRDLR